MKKILSVVLTMVLLLSVIPMGLFSITASAAYTDGYYSYTVSNGKATITDCDTSISGDVTIPSTLGGYPVTSIGLSAFSYCHSLTSVSIPDSVTSIGECAFYNCENLTGIEIPDSVTSIGEFAFENCTNLTSITIPDSVTSIGSWAFYNCRSLTSIAIPDGETRIAEYTFGCCYSLTSITIPDSVTRIDTCAFEDCNALTDVYYGGSYKNHIEDLSIGSYNSALTNATWHYASQDELVYEYNDDNLTASLKGCSPEAITIDVPKTVNKNGKEYTVTSIGEEAFYNCTSLTSITIPDSVTNIGDYAFANCYSLTSITIPDSVTSIGDCAFNYCKSLTSIDIPDSVTSIGINAFCACTSLTSITVDSENEYYSSDDRGFLFNKDKTTLIQYPAGNSATEYVIPDSVTSIGDCAFNYCTSLTSIDIPDSVTSIGVCAFRDCDSLTSITIPNRVTYIGEGAFYYCSGLTTINYNATNCTTIYYEYLPAFYNCKNLSTINIGDNVTNIPENAFRSCSGVTTVTIPSSLISIGYRAFYGCDNITNVYYRGTETQKLGIYVDSGNTGLMSVAWKYNSCIASDKHSYSNACDPDCNSCGAKRTVKHTYTNACDKDCNVCGTTRTPSAHKYSNNCDADCNVCKAKRTAPHSYKTKTTKATLSKNGSIVKTCSGCKKKVTTTVYYPKTISLSKTSYTYNGKVQKPTVTVKDSKGKVIDSKYYTISYSSGCKSPGTYKVTVKFKGNYSGTKTLSYKINPISISKCKVSISGTSYLYTGKTIKPTVKVLSAGGSTLKNGTHYTVTYSSGCKNPGTYKVTVKMKGTYTGSKTFTYKISKVDISKCKVTLSGTSYTYNGKVIKPSVKIVTPNGTTLKKDTHYTVTYSSGCKSPGTYKVTVKMKGYYTGSKTYTYKINKIDISKCKVSISGTNYTYDGKVKTPTITVKSAGGSTLKKDTHYTVSYAAGRKDVGAYTVKVTMKGNYTGSKTFTVTINPQKTEITNLLGISDSIDVTIAKKDTHITGYEIEYSTNADFSNSQTKIITGCETTKATISGLSQNTTYYVRVRTYTLVGDVKFYSGWSDVKSATTEGFGIDNNDGWIPGWH